jgi:hypothetical protein
VLLETTIGHALFLPLASQYFYPEISTKQIESEDVVDSNWRNEIALPICHSRGASYSAHGKSITLYDYVVMYLLSIVSYSNGALLSCDGRLLPGWTVREVGEDVGSKGKKNGIISSVATTFCLASFRLS